MMIIVKCQYLLYSGVLPAYCYDLSCCLALYNMYYALQHLCFCQNASGFGLYQKFNWLSLKSSYFTHLAAIISWLVFELVPYL